MASSEIEPAPADPRGAPHGQPQRGLLQRALREGVIITVLVAAIIAALHLHLAPSDPAKVN